MKKSHQDYIGLYPKIYKQLKKFKDMPGRTAHQLKNEIIQNVSRGGNLYPILTDMTKWAKNNAATGSSTALTSTYVFGYYRLGSPQCKRAESAAKALSDISQLLDTTPKAFFGEGGPFLRAVAEYFNPSLPFGDCSPLCSSATAQPGESKESVKNNDAELTTNAYYTNQ